MPPAGAVAVEQQAALGLKLLACQRERGVVVAEEPFSQRCEDRVQIFHRIADSLKTPEAADRGSRRSPRRFCAERSRTAIRRRAFAGQLRCTSWLPVRATQ